ncbi:MAG: GH1 family beta-glucosidase [Rhodospirillales bacterium]
MSASDVDRVENITCGPGAAAPLDLPPGFLWGVSTSSYQIEGAAREDGKGASIWDEFCRQKGRIANGDTGDVACDHYHRYAEDVGLMRRLGVGAYRFSVAWPRVLPAGRGQANPAGLDFYDRLTDALLQSGIEPWLCLYHWDLPQALDDLGGWTNRDIAGWFADYTALVARRFGDRIKRFATFNEPSVCTLFGYGMGWNAPGIARAVSFFSAAHHVNLAHGEAVDVIRALVPDATVGAVHNRQICVPATDSPEDAVAAGILDACWNRLYADPQCLAEYPPELAEAMQPFVRAGDMARIARKVDWFGMNHYSPIYARAASEPLGFAWADAPRDGKLTEIGWRIEPHAFRDELLATHRRYGLPVYVLENGAGGHDEPNAAGVIEDGGRIDYLRAYTAALADAVRGGADVRGYFVWSLLDNFEWGAGYASRFGLVYVDYPTQLRVPKASFDWFAGLIAANRSA